MFASHELRLDRYRWINYILVAIYCTDEVQEVSDVYCVAYMRVVR